MSKNKLNCKVGETWETTDPEFLKEIVFANEGTIVATSANDSEYGIIDRKYCAYMYDQYGQPKGPGTIFALTRKKVKMKTVNYKVFISLWHNEDYTWLGASRKNKDECVSNHEHFIKWIEADETFEVEDV
jgi:hypothetical protein